MSLFESDSIFGATSYYVLASGNVESNQPAITVDSFKTLQSVEPIGFTYINLVYPPEGVQKDSAELLNDLMEANDILRKRIQQAQLDDYYALLDLSDKYFDATIEDIQAAFKKLNLIMHPDKANTQERADAEKRFMALQKGYETLSDPKTRVAYDSSREFDESIPGLKDGLDDSFYSVYAPVFARNSRFSSVKPVPVLGDKDTPYENVDKFYKFWFSFKSWREFSHMDTERVGDSASRDERRRAEQQNKKAREMLKNAENARVRKLVDRAYAADPRIQVEKQRVLEEKKKALANRPLTAAEKKKQEAEAKKLAEAEAKKKKDEIALFAKQRAEEKKLIAKKTSDMKFALKKELSKNSAIKKAVADAILSKFTLEMGNAIEEARTANPSISILEIDAVKKVVESN